MPWLASMQSLCKPASYLGLSLMLVLISMIKPNPIRVDLHLGRLTDYTRGLCTLIKFGGGVNVGIM